MANDTLKELYLDELRDLYDAENQLIKALPKMAKASQSNELREGFEQHLEQTRGHAQRIEKIFQQLGEPVKGKKCKGMQGIVAEGGEIIQEGYEGAVMDAALISAAQRVEHYEIAAYGCVKAYAEVLGESDAVALLEETLNEEKETDQKLTVLSERVNSEATNGADAESGEDRKGVSGVKQKAARAGS